MFLIISIPHQSDVTFQSWLSREDFTNNMRVTSTNTINDFSDAVEVFTKDLHSYIFVERLKDLDQLIQYPTSSHKAFQVRGIFYEVEKEFFLRHKQKTMTGFDNLNHVTGGQTTAEKFGLDNGDIQTLFHMRQNGYRKHLLHTYGLAIQKFILSEESSGAMNSGMEFGVWKSYYFN